MSKADVLRAFRTITTDDVAAAKVAAGDFSGLIDVELTAEEQAMLTGAAAELAFSESEVVGFSWTDPAGGANNDVAHEQGLTFTRTGDLRPEHRYVKQLTHYVGLDKPTL